MVKTLVGYDIEPGVTPEEYDRWLFDVHVPDLLANPYLDRIVFNTTIRPVLRASGGSTAIGNSLSFYRIAEMHFADDTAYNAYLTWFDEHPIPPARGPAGRTAFRFYLYASVKEVDREGVNEGPSAKPDERVAG